MAVACRHGGRAGIDDRRDVHFVQIKCPLLTSERIEAAHARGNKTITTSAYGSMGYSRGASALGVAKALAEIGDDVREEHVLKNWDLFSSVASTSAGIELMHNVVIVMGNCLRSTSPFVIGHAVMRDLPDRFRRRRWTRRVRGSVKPAGARTARLRPPAIDWSMSSPRPRPRRTDACADSATPCSMIPTWDRPGMRAPPSAGSSADWRESAPSMSRAGRSIRGRRAGARSPSSRAFDRGPPASRSSAISHPLKGRACPGMAALFESP